MKSSDSFEQPEEMPGDDWATQMLESLSNILDQKKAILAEKKQKLKTFLMTKKVKLKAKILMKTQQKEASLSSKTKSGVRMITGKFGVVKIGFVG